jgi:hypothetical protein
MFVVVASVGAQRSGARRTAVGPLGGEPALARA